MKITKEMRHEIYRFCLTGGLCFLLEYALLFIGVEFLNINYLWSAGIAFTISCIINYIMCRRFVFTGKQKQGTWRTVVFMGSSIVGLGLNQLCMYFFVDMMGIYYMFAKILATAIVTVWNFITKKLALTAH